MMAVLFPLYPCSHQSSLFCADKWKFDWGTRKIFSLDTSQSMKRRIVTDLRLGKMYPDANDNVYLSDFHAFLTLFPHLSEVI